MTSGFHSSLPVLLLAAALLAVGDAARSSVESGPIERSFRNDAILREENRGVGRPLPGLADPLETGKIVAAFEHAEIDALESGDPVLPDPEEYYEYEDGFISPSGTYVEISPRDALRAEIPDVARLYFADTFDSPGIDESDPPPPPMNYTLLDEMIETRERMTARVGQPAAPEAEEREEPRIGRFLEEKEKPVLRLSKKLGRTVDRRESRRPVRFAREEEEDDEQGYEAEPAQRTPSIPRLTRSDAFRWPVVAKRISSRFGWRIHPIRRRRKFHNGVDLAANYGRPVIACGDGVVEYAGWKNYYGKTVIIRHPNGLKSLYAHCSKLNVARGDKVSGGACIAAIGSTGLSTGPHLHFGIMKNGQFVNPLPYLK